MDITISCSVNIETLNSQRETIKCEKIQGCSLALWRNEFREIVLSVSKPSKPSVKFVLRDVKIHSKFLNEGKSTIILLNHSVRLLLSNCPPAGLKKFFQVLSVKLLNFKKQSVSEKKKLLSCLPSCLDEISPLSEKDLDAVNNIKQPVKIANSKSVLGKRTSVLSDKTNSVVSDASTASSTSKKRKLVLSETCLNADQQQVINLIKKGKNVFFTGSAGTGKSYLLRHIIRLLPPSETFVTASTGIAACHIGGMTLHSFAGIHEIGPVNLLVKRVRSQKATFKQWKVCKHLIIDEISMIDAELFDCIESLARILRENKKPFGGIQVIVCGDFFQLPPVSKPSQKKQYCFLAQSWSKCIDYTWELQQVYRQTDSAFVRLLQEIRLGKCTAKTVAVLKKTQSHNLIANGIIPTKLCTHTEDVRQINQSELGKLSGKPVSFNAQDSSEHFTPILDKLLPETKLLTLKIGCQVMLTKNIDVSKKLVNGARGVVLAFTASQKPLPIIGFLNGSRHTMQLESYAIKASGDITMFRKQLPLKLAWAISIHKSQGMSLDSVEMSLSRVFEMGQAYVALSRATSLSGLRVLSFDSSCVCSSVDVLRFYRLLRERQRHFNNQSLSLLVDS